MDTGAVPGQAGVKMTMLLPALLMACGPARIDKPVGDPTSDAAVEVVADAPGPDAYDPVHVIDVQIELADADWSSLCAQTRDPYELLSGECQAQPFENPFTPFSATVTLDGETFGPVTVRKKGFLGSLSDVKPSLKIDLAEYDPTLSWSGVDHLTLNNAISDPSYVRQCLGFGVFTAAGVPAPRCSFARVTVNGEYLGVYANVEPIGGAFLDRHFSSDEGNLYEGTLSDFREGWTGTFQKKTNEEANDWSDIEAVVAALQVEDEALVEALEPLIDLDAFLTFWASEVLITHVDGYAWNTNNFLVYADPSDGRFRFIPWGIDSVFLPEEQIAGIPASVYAYGELTRRLYAVPDMRDRYLDRLRSLLGSAWNEEALLVEVDRMEGMVESELPSSDRAAARAGADDVRGMIQGQRDRILGEIGGGGIEWPYASRDSFCFTQLGTAQATFATTWGSLATSDAFTTGVATLDLEWGGTTLPTAQVGSVAGAQDGQAVLYVAAWLDATQAVVVYVTAPQSAVQPGDFPIAFGTAGLYYIDTATMTDFTFVAYIVGEVDLQEAETTEGGVILGSLDGELWSWG